MENPEKLKILGIPVLFAAFVAAVIYLLRRPVPATAPVKAVTSGSGLLNWQQQAFFGQAPVPASGNPAVVVPPNVASSYTLYNVQPMLNSALPPLNAPTANPAESDDITTTPGSATAYPWIPGTSSPSTTTGSDTLYAASLSDAVNALVAQYGDVFSKSMAAAQMAGYTTDNWS